MTRAGGGEPGVLPDLQPVMAFPNRSDRYLWEERRLSPDPSLRRPRDRSWRRALAIVRLLSRRSRTRRP